MKEHEVASLVNALTSKVREFWPDAPQQLREAIRSVVISKCHEHHWEQSWDGTWACKCGAWK